MREVGISQDGTLVWGPYLSLYSAWGGERGPTDVQAYPGPQGSYLLQDWRRSLPPVLPYWSTHFQLQVKETQLKVTLAKGGIYSHM